MIAIYARQSVDKMDSISIESQIEDCKTLLRVGEVEKVYTDRGFSGKDLHRPQFQQMLNDIKAGEIKKVIVWKLDRISRNLADSAGLFEIFDNNKVQFESFKEPALNVSNGNMGKLMRGILMVFAQFERETIQQRVLDNYYKRGEQGFYLGGHPPLGFEKVETQLFGKKTFKYEPIQKELELVKRMFDEYGNTDASLGTLLKWLNAEGHKTVRGNHWSNVAITRILHNPAYVKADAEVYNYFLGKGVILNNPVEDFIGTNGLYLYGDTKKKTRSKFIDVSGSFITIALHEGVIESDLWLRCQLKLDSNITLKNSGKGSHSWLSGILKCGYCGKAGTIVDNGRGNRYVSCCGRKDKFCYERKRIIHPEDLEEIVEKQLIQHIKDMKVKTKKKDNRPNPRINELNIQIAKLDAEIDSYIKMIPHANAVVMEEINKKVEQLDIEKKKLLSELTKLNVMSIKPSVSSLALDDYISKWPKCDREERKTIAKLFIKEVRFTDDTVNVSFYI